MQSLYNTMLKFHPDTLIDTFIQKYIYEHGEHKAREIVEKTTISPKMTLYLTALLKSRTSPTSKGITATLNTITYFIFCKGETLCMGALSFLSMWNDTCNSEGEFLTEDAVTQIAVDIIIDCSKLKFNRGNNLFSRFFQEIKKIALEEEARIFNRERGGLNEDDESAWGSYYSEF